MIETPVMPPVPAGRRAVLYAVRRRGDASAEDVAADLGITVSGARQHLAALVQAGLAGAGEADESPRRGRPRLAYHVTAAGDALFPKAYGALTNELLGYVEEIDASGVDRLFERRRDQRVINARQRLVATSPLGERVAELTRILDDDGYLAEVSTIGPDHYLVVEHNCAIAAVAGRYGQACTSEIDFIRTVLPDATVTRVSHMASGDRRCAYDVRAR